MRIVSIDIGGTHARFALAEVAGGKVVSLDEPVTLKTAEFSSFQTAWEHFGTRIEGDLPKAVAVAIAGPVQGEVIRFTNNPWLIRPALVNAKLGVDQSILINDFAAVGHAVAQAGPDHFIHLTGPEGDLPDGVTSVVGPGTGLGVAWVLRGADGTYHVQPTEGGHIDYAPLDPIEDAVLAHLRRRHTRVSVERVVAGPGLAAIHETLAALEHKSIADLDDVARWQAGTSGTDSLAAAAVDRFCLALGSVAGDIALAQGAQAVVIAGGLGLRIKDTLLQSGFSERFVAKGRFEGLMASIPVKLISHPQPGLFGAAAAFARKFVTSQETPS